MIATTGTQPEDLRLWLNDPASPYTWPFYE